MACSLAERLEKLRLTVGMAALPAIAESDGAAKLNFTPVRVVVGATLRVTVLLSLPTERMTAADGRPLAVTAIPGTRPDVSASVRTSLPAAIVPVRPSDGTTAPECWA